MVNFLGKLYAEGYQYKSLNAYRSAISSIHERVEGQSVGRHPLVSRLLKGQNPPKPRYSHFWDVGLVLRFIRQLGENNRLSLKWISIKLMALTRLSRSADLSQLNIRLQKYTRNGVIFQPAHLSKQSRSSKPINEFFFPFYTPDESLCPVKALHVYENCTDSFRTSTVFLANMNQSAAVPLLGGCQHASRRLVTTHTFKEHSVRGAACSSVVWSCRCDNLKYSQCSRLVKGNHSLTVLSSGNYGQIYILVDCLVVC